MICNVWVLDTPTRAIFYMTNELATRRIDVLTTGLAYHRENTAALYDLTESVDRRRVGSLKLCSGKRIKRNQVDFARHATQKIDQLQRVFTGVVNAFDQRVLNGYGKLALFTGDVASARCQQILNRILTVQGYELVSQLIVRGM